MLCPYGVFSRNLCLELLIYQSQVAWKKRFLMFNKNLQFHFLLLNSQLSIDFLIAAGGSRMSSLKPDSGILRSPQMTGSQWLGIRQRLKAQARRWMGRRVRGRLGSSDLIQETFAYSVGRLSEWLGKPKHEVYRWMIRVMKYRLLRQVAVMERRNEQGLNTLLMEPSLEGQVVEVLISAELRKLIDREIERQGPLARDIFHLHYEQGLSFAEIARILHKSPAAVRGSHYRTLEKLKENMAKHVR